jgi:large subunit ribosomal protein L17
MKKLGRKKAHREHTIRNLAASLILFETVDTTEAKAKVVKSFAEKLISSSKKNDLAARRKIAGILFDKNACTKIFSELVKRYDKKNSGFIRSFHLKQRLGDDASMMRLELVDKKRFVEKVSETKEIAKIGESKNEAK